jgi:DNA-binding beta-propeller fold protein YncE
VLGVGGAIAALVVIALVVVLAGGGGGGDKAVGEVVGKPIPVGKNPVDVEIGEGSVWTANSGEDTISRINPEAGTAQQIKVGGIPSLVAAGEGGAWAYNYRDAVTRVDINTGKLSDSVDVGGEPASLLVQSGTLWVSLTDKNQVVRFDAATGVSKGAPIAVGKAPGALVSQGNSIFVANSADRTISTIDVNSATVLGNPLKVPSTADLGGMDIAEGTLWVGTNDNSVTPIDAQSFTIGEPVKVAGASYFNPSTDGLWLAYPNTDLLELLEPTAPYKPKGEPVRGVAKSASDMDSADGTLYIANGRLNTVTRVKF